MTTLKSNLLKKGKKGFTLTELAIVIAVIAILIAVLVPTFTSVITSARETAAAEDATHAITAYTLEEQKGLEDGSVIKVVNGSYTYYFEVEGGAVGEASTTQPANLGTLQEYSWTGTDYETTFTNVTVYYVLDTNTAAKYTVANATATAALTAFNESTSYGASTSNTNTAEYILVASTTSDTSTYLYEVNGTTVVMLNSTTAAALDLSSYSSTTVYYTSNGMSSTDSDTLATVYYNSQSN